MSEHQDLLKEFFEVQSVYVSDSAALGIMQIARLERIAEALEHISDNLGCLSNCISPQGSFCIAGDIVSSDY